MPNGLINSDGELQFGPTYIATMLGLMLTVYLVSYGIGYALLAYIGHPVDGPTIVGTLNNHIAALFCGLFAMGVPSGLIVFGLRSVAAISGRNEGKA